MCDVVFSGDVWGSKGRWIDAEGGQSNSIVG